jgi:hypothetical protein
MKNVRATTPSYYRAQLKFTVELQPGVWISSWGRTLVKKSAKPYKTRAAAKGALTRARKSRGHGYYLNAVITPVTAISLVVVSA